MIVPTCPRCSNRFNELNNVPKIFPCGKTVCQNCEQNIFAGTTRKRQTFRCDLCMNKHSWPTSLDNFPMNEILLDCVNRENPKSILKNKLQTDLNVRIDLEQLKSNVCKLGAIIQSLKESMTNRIESKMNECLKVCDENLMRECQNKINKLNHAASGATNEKELENITSNVKYMNTQVLELIKYLEERLNLNANKKNVNSTILSANRSKVKYLLSKETQNIEILTFSNNSILKITELPNQASQLGFHVVLELIDLSGVLIKKNHESIDSFRMKKVKTNNACSHIVLLLVNNSLDLHNLRIFDQKLKFIRKVDLNFSPIDVHVNDFDIYVESSNVNKIFHKYNFSLEKVRAFGQSVDAHKCYFIPKSYELVSIHNDKLYFKSNSIKVLSESNGQCLQTIEFKNYNLNANNIVKIDSTTGNIFVLDTSRNLLNIFDVTGAHQRQIGINSKISSIDSFFLLPNELICIVDKRNHYIHFIYISK